MNSPALATEPLTASHAHSPAGGIRTVGPHARHTRAVWFLAGWLIVSATMIAIAGVVIAKYF